MSRAFNFSAGPAALPESVLQQARDELLDWQGHGASVMELSHRGKPFMAVAEQAEADLRTLLAVPDSHHVLFLQGGATTQFALIPMNFAQREQSADYVVTGHWGEKAVREAQSLCRPRIAASSECDGFLRLPSREGWDLDPEAAYVHYTPNETIGGVEFHEIPDVGAVPLIADMSSTLLSRPLDVSRFGMIYAGAQKNIGPAGLTIVIVSDELLQRCPRPIASILDYREHRRQASMLNTPPTFAWYLSGLVFRWLLDNGGLSAAAERNAAKAALLYDCIDSSDYYRNPIDRNARSWMNVPFFLPDPRLDAQFLAESEQAGLLALKGHRVLGGMRASLYNAMPLAGVRALVDFMHDFAQRHPGSLSDLDDRSENCSESRTDCSSFDEDSPLSDEKDEQYGPISDSSQ